MAGTGQGSKREATEYLIQEINNFNPLHLRLTEPEIVMICRVILPAARAEQNHNANDNDNEPPTSEVLLAMSAFRRGVAEHWAVQAMLPVVDQMFTIPTTFEGDRRRQLTRKFAKAILSSFDRAAVWFQIEQMKFPGPEEEEEEGDRFTTMEDVRKVVVEPENHRPSGKHRRHRSVESPNQFDRLRSEELSSSPPIGTPRHRRRRSRKASQTGGDDDDHTVDAFLRQNVKGEPEDSPTPRRSVREVMWEGDLNRQGEGDKEEKEEEEEEEEPVSSRKTGKGGKKKKNRKGKGREERE